MRQRGTARTLVVAGIAGACSMTLELSAVRLVAPWFGASSVVWTHVIGVVLLALSTGYLLGARLSRRAHPSRSLGVSLLVAAGVMGWLPAAAQPVAAWFRPSEVALDEAAELLRWGSLATSLVLFLPPTLLLGCVPPLATEILQRVGAGSAGEAGGRVLAFSTFGSIAGTFATTYLVLPELGLTSTYLACAAILAVLGLVAWTGASRPVGIAPGLLALPVLGALLLSRMRAPALPEGVALLESAESAYQTMRVVEDASGLRRLEVNEGFDSFQSVWQEDPGFLPDGYYYNLFALPPWWSRGRSTWRVFVIGLGAGTTWRVLAGTLPKGTSLRASGAEIDPEVVRLGRAWFDLPPDGADRRVLSGWDGRNALAFDQGPFDEIVLDAYANQMEIPAHLCTVEFFAEVRDRLAPGGWLAVNVGGFGLDDPVVVAVAATAARAFERRVLGLRVPFSRNCVLYVRSGDDPPEPGGEGWTSGDRGVDERLSGLAIDGAWRWYGPTATDALTDDRNAIDRLQWDSVRGGRSRWLSAP